MRLSLQKKVKSQYTLNLRSRREEDVTLDFEVKDSGIGIPESSLGNIFESFTQASSDTTRKFGGTGLRSYDRKKYDRTSRRIN